MRIYTRQFGELTVSEDKVIYFEEGIIGFPEYKRFVLLETDVDRPFLWLMSLDEPEFCLPLLPGDVVEGYREGISLYLKGRRDQAVYVVVTLGREPESVTVNLKGPILIDVKNGKGRQVIIDSDAFALSYPLLGDVDTDKEAR
ncbi:MAG TPA: flagellar assembly protein FliW [Candidatus Latescibacteria bacterium]|nr:flagellar assembly protein FliW [Candidatus Latescibacterota bacterium]